MRARVGGTLTTVLGLAPLLYESSSQAQFLKPTVITLVYGLGFGLVLVLVAVPALLAMQADASSAFRSLRRAVAGRARFARGTVGLAGLAIAVLFAVTFGPLVLGLSSLIDSPGTAFAAFAFGVFVIAVLSSLLAALTLRLRR